MSEVKTTWFKFLIYLSARLREPSTYPALALVLTALGHIIVTPDQRDALTVVGMFAAGAIGAILPDKLVEKDQPKEGI